MSKIYISWEEFYLDAKKLSAIIRTQQLNKHIEGLICITRGGLAPTAVIASELNIKNIEVFCLSTYSADNERNDTYVTYTKPEKALEVNGKDWIIIDELVDTGNTVSYIKKFLPEAKFYSVYSKITNIEALDGYVKVFPPFKWLCFPWEKGI